jgi:DHA2 family multidrug resistance protein-like MFS transporter
MISIIGLQIFLSKGSSFGWTSALSLGLFAAFVIFGFIFYRIESKNSSAFVDFGLFKNLTYTGATISNFLLNATAGILIVSLSLVQLGAGLSSQESGLLTLGYAIAIIAFIRVGEKLLQKFGARKPMIWGSLIVGVSIIMLMQTQVMTETYKILAIVSYTLFGIGLAFYATPSTDAALSNLPENQAGAGSGIYKMASSLGVALGVAVSAAIFTALSGSTGEIEWLDGLISFSGRQDNLAIRQGAMIALGVNLIMVIAAIISIMLTVPKHEKTA